MSARPGEPPALRRVLVALDASPQSLAALEDAVVLAARADADVRGLFVEDLDALRLAGRAAQIVDALTAATRATDAAEMERALRSVAASAERALAQAASRGGVRWSFRVARGRVVAEILAEARAADVVCVGCSSWAGGRGVRLGRTARQLAAEAPGAVLFARGTPRRGLRPVLVHDGSPGAERALRLAASIARHDGRPLRALLLPGSTAAARVRAAAPDADVETLPDDAAETVASRVAATEDALLVVPRPEGRAHGTLARLLAAAGRPVLGVR